MFHTNISWLQSCLQNVCEVFCPIPPDPRLCWKLDTILCSIQTSSSLSEFSILTFPSSRRVPGRVLISSNTEHKTSMTYLRQIWTRNKKIFEHQAFALDQWPHLSLQNRPCPPSQVITVAFSRFLTQRSSTTQWQLQITEPRETYLIKAWVVTKGAKYDWVFFSLSETIRIRKRHHTTCWQSGVSVHVQKFKSHSCLQPGVFCFPLFFFLQVGVFSRCRKRAKVSAIKQNTYADLCII